MIFLMFGLFAIFGLTFGVYWDRHADHRNGERRGLSLQLKAGKVERRGQGGRRKIVSAFFR